jgi:protein-S-isoprenylcysteine O-methyltransferase Ste14
MNTTEHSNQRSSKRSGIPRWLVLVVALIFWLVGVPIFYGVLPWAISLLTPRYGWSEGRPTNWNLLGLIPVVLATVCLIWVMILHFAQAPGVPERVELELTPKNLLLLGPYAFSRNPMYLAELALLLGWAIFYGSIAVSITFLIACAFFHFVIVPREERTLEARFGEAYREYKKKVPRWF